MITGSIVVLIIIIIDIIIITVDSIIIIINDISDTSKSQYSKDMFAVFYTICRLSVSL